MEDMCREIRAHADTIVKRWDKLTTSEPWSRMPEDWRINHLPRVVEGLAEIALGSAAGTEKAREYLQEITRHGSERRRQAVDEVYIFREFHYLWRALGDFVRERYEDDDASTNAILRLDAGIGLATRASLLGYYREELEAQDRWEGALDRLLREAPFVPAD